MIEVGLNSLHEVEASLIKLGNIGNAALVDSTEGDVGSSPGKANTKGPAGLVYFLSTLFSTIFELILTSTGGLALSVLIRALSLDAFHELRGLSKGQSEDEAEEDNNLHGFKINIVID